MQFVSNMKSFYAEKRVRGGLFFVILVQRSAVRPPPPPLCASVRLVAIIGHQLFLAFTALARDSGVSQVFEGQEGDLILPFFILIDSCAA